MAGSCARGYTKTMRAGMILALLAMTAGAALAQERGPQPLDRVLPEIRRNTPGTFYDAEGPFFDPSGQAHYRIKWMTPDGRIVWFDADARTGRVLGGGPVTGDRRPPDRFRGDDYPRDHGSNRGYGDRGQPPSGYNDGGHDDGGRGGDGGGRGGGNWNGGGRGGGDRGGRHNGHGG
jgi:hypothetical protein